ncbi:hypothetical protein ELH80_33590 [Rhizobium ruizarguesonis]|jgi:hypothetical protein|uniref:Uncharacterized protein n=1 Tax=Rhizobium ruizarguesonis TaxID=2081791 RepID=A0AAE8Q6D2_9HYPH|nr:hypothetical protein [Rhizobium ruizarguesonis]MCB2406297.1 hypothetical protein [Rhizobium ruizarguesonis]NEI53244.1 hypothetical protein [Rhizobium ruizarguesonis]TAY70471.1 hypothetical protein ELH86_30855 [Rhizobium ruizarguesonis]TAZ24852.1 hypothetical protein ELH80_33590 [Rhizobium ruizarguesonis]TBA56354.1 hypothetical protein ELH58_32520 [Rhizobium ruizarguesonis]
MRFFRAAIAVANDAVLMQAMIEASISRVITVDGGQKHLVYVRNIIQTTGMIAAQSQTSRDALLTLNIIKHRHDIKKRFQRLLKRFASAGTQSGCGRVRLPWSGVGGDGVPEIAVENRGAAQYLLPTILDVSLFSTRT